MTDHCRDIFNALIGQWMLKRIITPGGVFEGTATFARVSEGVLNYKEEGLFTLDNGNKLNPTKSYQWCLEEGSIVVYFNDGVTKGQRFHELEFISNASAMAKHLCSPDTYDSQYSFSDMPQRFTITHVVEGPEKDYTSVSAFTKS